MTVEQAICDLCGGQAFELLYPGTADVAEDPALYYGSSRQKAGHLPIVRCRGCGLVLSNPRDDLATRRQAYAQLADEDYAAEEFARQWVAAQRLDWIEKWVDRARLIDVGCATGVFVGQALGRGWWAEGVDPSLWALARARQRWPQARFHPGMLEDLPLPEQRFDVLTLWDVLEHVQSPTALLSRAAEWVKPGGWLALNVPNVSSFSARWMGRRWVLLLREHLWYFSPKTLRALLARTGWRLIAQRPNRTVFSAANVLRRLAQYDLPGLRRASNWPVLRRLWLPVWMGELNALAQRVAE
ncbi:MAG: class I SAM-dependent methyltransferase [Anaerolinea sp.]|nr:class I SAM-dependent methyltransferase [Anaerolinea sp.]